MPALPETSEKRLFYHQTFVMKDKDVEIYRHTLLVNPQDMSVAEPARINPQQTLGGAYVAKFGQGLHQITLGGITGYNARRNAEGIMTDGYEEIKNFRDKVYRYFLTNESSQVEMFWYNWEDEEYYKVVPTSFRIMRNVSQPLLYRYELAMTAIEKIGVNKKPTRASNMGDRLSFAEAVVTMSSSISSIGEAMHSISKGGR